MHEIICFFQICNKNKCTSQIPPSSPFPKTKVALVSDTLHMLNDKNVILFITKTSLVIQCHVLVGFIVFDFVSCPVTLVYKEGGLELWCLTPLSTIFQLNGGGILQ